MTDNQRRTSTLSLLGCGCAALVTLVMLAVVGITYFTYRQAKGLQENFTDPEKRAEKVAELMRPTAMPEGYQPLGGFRVPFLMDLAVLTDKAEPEGGEDGGGDLFDRGGFFYVSTFGFGRDDAEIRAYFEEGEEQGSEGLRNVPFDVESGGEMDVEFGLQEEIDRGEVPIPGGRALYVARRGELRLEGERTEGLSTMVYLDCDDDNRMRFGLWFEMAPETAEGEEMDLTGSPADPPALEAFLGHFRVCT